MLLRKRGQQGLLVLFQPLPVTGELTVWEQPHFRGNVTLDVGEKMKARLGAAP